jgi:hypothetical protein
MRGDSMKLYKERVKICFGNRVIIDQVNISPEEVTNAKSINCLKKG